MSEMLDHLLAEETRLRLRRTRTVARLREFPDLLAHIMGHIVPGGPTGGDKVGGTKEVPLPLNATAREDADGLYSSICDWTTNLARNTRQWPPASLLANLRHDVDMKGLPGWADATYGAALLRDPALWLARRVDLIDGTNSGEAFHDDIADIARRLFGRYPMEPRILRGTCERCGKRRVELTTTEVTVETRLRCDYCGDEPALHRYEALLRDILEQSMPGPEGRW